MDVSVIIPTKNRLWSLPKAVESCRGSELDVQIIVVDDASTDGTREWLREQSDVTVVNGEGWGKPWGVNRAMLIATGDYVRYLDSDDWLNAGSNEAQFGIGQRECADAVVAGYDIYEGETFKNREVWVSTDDFIAQQLGETFFSHYSAFLFRREFVCDIPHRTLFPAADFASRDDRCFILEAALRHPKLAVCVQPTLCHRHHQQTRLQFRQGLQRDGTHIQQLYIYRQILRLLTDRGELTTRRKRAVAKVLWPLAHWLGYSYPNEAAQVADWVYDLVPDFDPPEKGAHGWLYRTIGFRRTEQILRMRRGFRKMFIP